MTFRAPVILNPATLLPDEAEGPVLHNCQDILAEETGILEDLKDQPLDKAEVIWYTDGNSFVQEVCRCAGAAVVSGSDVGPNVWQRALLPSGLR